MSGWGGVVYNVQSQAGGGYLVTLWVNPFFSASPYGTTITIGSDYSEQYYVDASNIVHYRGFLDPNGWAGQEPMFVSVE
jgi:hypothetical protein